MIAQTLKAVTRLSRPLRSIDRRSRLLEWLLDLRLSPDEFASVRTACDYSSTRLGAYYHWKIAQLTLVANVKRLSRARTMALVSGSDKSRYDRLDAVASDQRGLLIATPHYGHFVLSIVSLAQRLSRNRRVFVFYDPPEKHTSNEIFDVLHGRIFGDHASKVSVIHNNRAGIACALKELHKGSAVVIMPDVYKDVHDTYQIPFCGRVRNVMLGTAVLARKTNAVILPMLSRTTNEALEFESLFGEAIFPTREPLARKSDAEATTHADYSVVMEMFGEFERLMERNLVHWQYNRSHFIEPHQLHKLSPLEIDRATELFLADPRVRVSLASPVALD